MEEELGARWQQPFSSHRSRPAWRHRPLQRAARWGPVHPGIRYMIDGLVSYRPSRAERWYILPGTCRTDMPIDGLGPTDLWEVPL